MHITQRNGFPCRCSDCEDERRKRAASVKASVDGGHTDNPVTPPTAISEAGGRLRVVQCRADAREHRGGPSNKTNKAGADEAFKPAHDVPPVSLVEATPPSAEAAARSVFRDWATGCAREWGWDSVVQCIAEAMAYTKPRASDERAVMTYAHGIGWPALLAEVAEMMRGAGVYLDVFISRTVSDERDEEPQSADAVDPHVPPRESGPRA